MASFISCPLCEEKFKQEKKFFSHCLEQHNVSDVEELYVNTFLAGQRPTCGCGCGTLMKWLGWREGYNSKFVRGHNAIVETCFSNPEKMSEIVAKRIKGYSEGKFSTWNKGLTKETSEKIKQSAEKAQKTLQENYASGQYVSWQTGLTKETNESLRKSSETKKQKLKTGESKVWNQGLTKESKGQLEVLEFVRSLGFEAHSNVRTVIAPKEIDVWIPTRSLGIEYNGLWWHSINYLNKNYHEMKQEAAQKAGVSLFSIYEDEWQCKQTLVKEMIKHRLGLHKTPISARECLVVERDATAFFDKHHLEGAVRASHSVCLVHPETGEIVAAQSLRKPFHKKYNGSLELARSCCHSEFSVPGWLGRLTKACKKYCVSRDIKEMVTYVDNRLGQGFGYYYAGWELKKSSTGPRFWWTDGTQRYNRFKFKADKTKGLTQAEVAQAAGVYEIWGCGNSLLTYAC